jgi:hypothetical protein
MKEDSLLDRYKKLKKHKRLSRGNLKVSKDVGIFNLPAGTACLNCKDCLSTCYARQAQIMYPNVREFRNCNYHLATTNPDLLATMILEQIDKEQIKIVRIHESGDFISVAYIKMWEAIITKRPRVKFYAYTKVYNKFTKTLKDLDSLPNCNIIDSFIEGFRNYGSEDYINKLQQKAKIFVCPTEGCMDDCKYCLDGKNVAFVIHGTLKSKDEYNEEI